MAAALSPARAGTAVLTVTALGLVLGLSSSAVLPLLLPWQGMAPLAGCSVGLALLPALGLLLAQRGARLPRLGWGAFGAATLSGLSLLLLWNVYRAQLRVLNLGEEPFALWIDGKRLTRVEPSSGESALAGVDLTVPAGAHALRVTSELDGRELYASRQTLQGGSPHLFAPNSSGYCFSIERRAYGDARGEPLSSEPLTGSSSFWLLPDGIAWFTPNPEPGAFQTSGGTLSCLRQKRCGS